MKRSEQEERTKIKPRDPLFDLPIMILKIVNTIFTHVM